MPQTHYTIWAAAGVLFLVLATSLGLLLSLTRESNPETSSTTSQPPQPTLSASPTTKTSSSASITPTIEITALAPTFTKLSQNRVSGANLWLFPVDDGEAKLAVSTEQAGSAVLMGRLDPANPASQPSWQQVASKNDTDGSGIADHWHIYAHDAHWLVFSVSEANRSYLIKLDKNFNRLAFAKVADQETVSADELATYGLTRPNDPLSQTQGTPVSTNDMFIVAEPDGVAISHFLPGVGSKIYRFDTKANLRTTTIIGGTEYQYNNGSSAQLVDGTIEILGSENLVTVAQGWIRLITTSSDWQPLSSQILIDEDRVNHAMGTSLTLPSGYRIVTARAVSGTYPRGEMPPPPKPGGTLSDDSGAIVRYIFDANLKQVDKTVLQEKDGNRPHMALVGNKLYTGWDGAGSATLRVDEISSQ
jgi:hypothetical protein